MEEIITLQHTNQNNNNKMRHSKKPLAIITLLLSSFLTLTSCSDSDENPVSTDTVVTPEQETTISQDEQKEYIETIAKEIDTKISAADFAEIASLGAYLNNTYIQEYDWEPSANWGRDILNDLRRQVGIERTENFYDYTNSYDGVRYIYNNIYTDYKALIMASNFTGHFIAENGKWTRVKANDLQFIFKDENGSSCVLKLETSGDVKKVYALSTEDWRSYDYYTDGNTYISNEYYDVTQYTIGVPENIVVKLTQDNRDIIAMTANINLASLEGENFNISKSSFTVSAVTTFNNGYKLDVSQVAYTEYSNALLNFVMSKNGESLITVAASTDLNNLPSCNISAFEEFEMDSYENGNVNAKNTFVKVDLLGKIQIQGAVRNAREFVEANENANKNKENESLFKQYISEINKQINIGMFYDGTDVRQAELTMEPFEHQDWYYGKFWTAEPVLKFHDGSSYSSIKSFFNRENFMTTIDIFNRLLGGYADLM